MQQLAPVNTWGNNFFVPVSNLAPDRVRIVVSQNNTKITQTGGIIQEVSGAQTVLENLQAGQFVELEMALADNGCYIEADKPIGVCSFLKSAMGGGRAPAQCWIPAVEQLVPYTQIAPFAPLGSTTLLNHYALVCTPTGTESKTLVSVGGAASGELTGDIWRNNVAADMSFYIMPLTNEQASYSFSNQEGLIVLIYGHGGDRASYYYLAGSAMRDLDVAFYANDIHFQELKDTIFCEHEVAFQAEIMGALHPDPGRLKWYIDGLEEEEARDQLEWSKIFSAGEHEITMLARLENGDEVSKTGILKINPFCCGAGTKENPYLICTAAQLDSVRLFLDAHFKLANDIPLSDYLSSGAGHEKWGGAGWEPIGTAEDPFTGSLNGDGYKITGLWINRNSNHIGLFGVIDGATIENVGVVLNQ